MNEEQLDELLARKRASVSGEFERGEAQFSEDFFARIDRRPAGARRFWCYAAGFLLLLAPALFRLLPGDPPRRSAVETAFVKIDEAIRVADINARSVADRLAAAGIDCRLASLGVIQRADTSADAAAMDCGEWVRKTYGLDLIAVESAVRDLIVRTQAAASRAERGDPVQ